MKGHYLALMFSWMACSNTDLLHAESPRFTANLTVKSGLTETETTPEFDKHNIGPQLKIRVYRFPGTSAWLLDAAQKEAARILRGAHVELNWIDCRTSTPSGSCTFPEHPTELVVRIVQKALPQVSSSALGLRTWSGKSGCAFIFYDRAEVLQTHTRPLHLILGRVLGHEMTHFALARRGSFGCGLDERPLEWR